MTNINEIEDLARKLENLKRECIIDTRRLDALEDTLRKWVLIREERPRLCGYKYVLEDIWQDIKGYVNSLKIDIDAEDAWKYSQIYHDIHRLDNLVNKIK